MTCYLSKRLCSQTHLFLEIKARLFNILAFFEFLKSKNVHLIKDNHWFFYIISVSPCASSPCENDGTCAVDANGMAVCACKGDYSGPTCSGRYSTLHKC